MTAVRIHELGDPASLTTESEPVPQPADGQVLVRVHAAAITRDELTWPEGRLPAIPSYEVSGEVVDSGELVYALADFEKDGAAAQYIAIDASRLAPKPANLTHARSAAVPLAALSAWQGLFDHGLLEAGQSVLIHGAAGAVGAYAVQFARRAGAHVFAVASGDGLAKVAALGADEVIDRTTTRFEDAANTVDLVFDTVGGDVIDRSRAVLGSAGRFVTIASEPPADWAGDNGPTAIYFIVEPNHDQLTEITGLIENSGLRTSEVVTFALADARAAFEASLDREHRGKVVFEVIPES